MRGGAGSDIHVVDNPGHVVDEIRRRLRRFRRGADLLDHQSLGRQLSRRIEAVTLTGIASINAIGNLLANVLTGNNGSNVLNGQAGADNARSRRQRRLCVDNAGDFVSESLPGSFRFDRVLSSEMMNPSNTAPVSGANVNAVGPGNSKSTFANTHFSWNVKVLLRAAFSLTKGKSDTQTGVPWPEPLKRVPYRSSNPLLYVGTGSTLSRVVY